MRRFQLRVARTALRHARDVFARPLTSVAGAAAADRRAPRLFLPALLILLLVPAAARANSVDVFTLTPGDGQTIGQTVVWQAGWSGAKPPNRVEFWVDDVQQSLDRSEPFTSTLDPTALPAGEHRLRIVGVRGNARSTDEIRILVADHAEAPTPPPTPVLADTRAPSVPGDLRVLTTSSSSVALAWSTSTDDTGVVGYGVYKDGKIVSSTADLSAVVPGLQCGQSYQFAVDAQDAAGNRSGPATLSAATLACPAVVPTNTAVPVVSGPAQVGATLTASPGSWSGTSPISFAYQWLRCDAAGAGCNSISGATRAVYVLTASDERRTIRAAVTAANSAGTALALSLQTAPIAPSAQAPVVYKGIWMSKQELDGLPMSGTAWLMMKEAADSDPATWGSVDIQDNASPRNVKAMAAALVYARMAGHSTAATAYRTKVRNVLDELVNFPLAGGSITGPARNLGAFAIAADLINLPQLDPPLDARFRLWLQNVMTKSYSGAGGGVRSQATNCLGGNTTFMARFSVSVAEMYRGDPLTQMIDAIKKSTNPAHDYSLSCYTNDQAEISWQGAPYEQRHTHWHAIKPAGATRDGHDFSGIIVNDMRRENNLYDRNNYPGTMQTNYPYIGLEGIVGYAWVHFRMQTGIHSYAANHPLRAAQRLKVFSEQKGWPYFESLTGNKARHQMVPVLNRLYGTNWPFDPSQNRPLNAYGWTMWTHQKATGA